LKKDLQQMGQLVLWYRTEGRGASGWWDSPVGEGTAGYSTHPFQVP